jgi:hypothetical protein
LQLDYGQFSLTVEGSGTDECYRSFDVIPRAGYRSAEVRLSVIDPRNLDYDNGSCNNIKLKVCQVMTSFCLFSGIHYGTKAKIT